MSTTSMHVPPPPPPLASGDAHPGTSSSITGEWLVQVSSERCGNRWLVAGSASVSRAPLEDTTRAVTVLGMSLVLQGRGQRMQGRA